MTRLESLIECLPHNENDKKAAMNILMQLNGMCINQAKDLLGDCIEALDCLIIEVGKTKHNVETGLNNEVLSDNYTKAVEKQEKSLR